MQLMRFGATSLPTRWRGAFSSVRQCSAPGRPDVQGSKENRRSLWVEAAPTAASELQQPHAPDAAAEHSSAAATAAAELQQTAEVSQREQQRPSRQQRKRPRNLAIAPLASFFRDPESPNTARVAVYDKTRHADAAALIYRILTARPEAEICVSCLGDDAAYVATRALCSAHLALVARKSGLQVQPKKLDGDRPLLLLWVTRGEHKLGCQEEDPFKVATTTSRTKLTLAILGRSQQLQRCSLHAVGAPAVAKAWAALAAARALTLKQQLPLDLRLTPEAFEVELEAKRDLPATRSLRVCFMVETCEPLKREARSRRRGSSSGGSGGAYNVQEQARPKQQQQQQQQPEQQQPEQQKLTQLTPEQAEEMMAKIAEMQAQLKALMEKQE